MFDVGDGSSLVAYATDCEPDAMALIIGGATGNALGELNFQYDVVLISRLNETSLAGYKAVVIPDLTWVDDNHIRLLERYRKEGGQILTVGSSESIRKISSASLPASVCQEVEGGMESDRALGVGPLEEGSRIDLFDSCLEEQLARLNQMLKRELQVV